MARIAEQLAARRHLHQLAQIHHAHAVGNVFHHAHVVRHKQVGQLVLRLQVLQDVEHLRLNGHIQRGHGLITHYEFGLQCQGARNANALALAAGKLMRIAARVILLHAHAAQRLDHALKALRARADAMHQQALANALAHRHARVQRGVRILKDNLHVAAQLL